MERKQRTRVTDRGTRKAMMSRRKLQMEWYANGFDPDRKKQNQDFAKAVKQTALTFDVERMGGQRYSGMNGIDAIVTSPPADSKGHLPEQTKAKNILIKEWKPILRGESGVFRIIGAKVLSDELSAWVFHLGTQTLFMLHFTRLLAGDDWLDKPIYSFTQ